MTIKTVGMIGVGQIGLPVAQSLVAAGFEVVGFRRTDRHRFEQVGGIAMNSPAEVAHRADCLLLCLPSEEAQVEVFDGPKGIGTHLRAGQPVIELGSYRREFKNAYGTKVAACGAIPIECEISGSPPMVAERRVALMLGGNIADIALVKPVLDAISPNQFRIGEFGAAVNIKLIANMLVAVHTLAAAEAMNLASRAGCDLRLFIDVIKSGAGSSAMFALRAPFMEKGTFQPAPGPFATMDKYVSLVSGLATELECATPLLDAARPYYNYAMANAMNEDDIAAVYQLVASNALCADAPLSAS